MSALKKLGRYELVEQLGQGGMGEVWLARLSGAAGFEKACLLKTVLPKLAGDAQFVSRFQHEGRVLVHLQHANIAQVLDMGDEGGALFLALEYVMGVDVQHLHDAVFRNGGQLPVPMAVWLCQQAAFGLAYAHQKAAPDGTALAIVHRDVSPHNLMVSYDGEVKVIDFGIARSAARTSNTQAQTVMGKIGYMAPEQARGEALDARADQYALGIVLWELLTDQPYVRPGTVGEMMGSMANPQPRAVREYRPDVPVELEEVVGRSLAAKPEARFADMAAFAAALGDVLAQRYRAPTREEVSAYVREKCSAQWAEHQKLLSRISTGAKPAAEVAPAGIPTTAPTRASSPARGQTPVPAPVEAASTRALRAPARVAPPPDDDRLAARPSRLPVLVVVVVAASVAVGVFTLLSGGAARVVVKPEAPAVDVKPDAAHPAAVKRPTPRPLPLVLPGTARILTAPEWAIELQNTGNIAWTSCAVSAPGRRKTSFYSLKPGLSQALPAARFEIDPGAEELVGKVHVRCNEGSWTFPLRE